MVSTIQESNQKKLNGKPRTMGSMRSQRETEKHIPANGISARRIAPNEGFFTLYLRALPSSEG